jgi:hypothetical protein
MRALESQTWKQDSVRTTGANVNWRRARRFVVSAIALDIVFPFGKMSTKPDQAQVRKLRCFVDAHHQAPFLLSTMIV